MARIAVTERRRAAEPALEHRYDAEAAAERVVEEDASAFFGEEARQVLDELRYPAWGAGTERGLRAYREDDRVSSPGARAGLWRR
ncbi:MAG: hypothetical protein U0235_30380 [Polyangiaceae bacterium]